LVKRPRKNHLETWEISLIKAMVNKGDKNDQDILAYFTRPNRTVNHARISEIRWEEKHARIKSASDAELTEFLATYPLIDWETGLHLYGDELLIKAREAILNAVQTYNNPKTWFRSEIFIVSAIIAWTYLLHAYFKSEGVDYRYYETKDGKRQIKRTKSGAECYWELTKCFKAAKCPLDPVTMDNLSFLLEIRHEIEHRMTRRIDDAISAKLQACCHNFNTYIKKLFGDHLGLDGELSFAIQFSQLSLDQQRSMARAQELPENILLATKNFEDTLPDEVTNDPRYAVRVALIPITTNRKGKADQVVEYVKSDSAEGEAINKIILKGVEKDKYKPKQVVELMNAEEFPKFSMTNHTRLWQSLDARNPNKSYGVRMRDGQWYWYETWVERVREHCREKSELYMGD
jgi:hypothetical protein